jgi:phosphoglycolate phosphatase
MKLKVVAFDCDGVIFDSLQSNIAFYNQILRHFNRPPMSPAEVEYIHCHTVHESMAYILHDYPDYDEVERYYRTLDSQEFISLMVQEPFLLDFLQYLKPRFGRAVATNRSTTTQAVFTYHGLEEWFDIIVSARDVVRPKPHPELFDLIMTHYDITPEEVIYIGDSIVDQEFARNAGVRLVAYRNPDLEADYYLESFAQGPELIKSIIGG